MTAEAPVPPLIVVAGPTATGKTELAIRLAEGLRARGRPAAVISADSRQVFRGLDIGTAKVSETDRARVPHHGIDLVYPDQPFSVADFVARTRGVLGDLADEGAVAILAGGTGLYLRAVARGIDMDALPSDSELRSRLETELQTDGLLASVARLEHLAPGLAAGVDLRNPRRVVRALEIAELRGDGPPPAPRGYPGPVTWLGLSVHPHVHATRIAVRAKAQFDAGLVEEARELRERFDPTLPAFSAIGYREAWAVIDGKSTLAAAIELDRKRNLAFSKRQRTWFRSEPDITWLDATEELPDVAALEAAERLLEEATPAS
ncbi:MAG TPA: tRNA (adenosine(37)-N6)-dimethylallyltransferase MiaA [Candidatus Limnocylindrales bacterium]|nr:tRNA (adenosine(37)-N6)-dimethylallyltransferase MiaA [Candidatus Limnocylindrales bacterium]